MIRKITVLSVLAISLLGGTAFAQEPPVVAPPATATPQSSGGTQAPAPLAPAKRVDKTRTSLLKDVLKKIEEGAGGGVRIAADSSVADEMVAPLTVATTPENFEDQVASVVRTLPRGTAWAKLYLPAAETRSYKGDDLTEYAMAQSKLFGRVGEARPGTIEIMGKSLPVDKAQAVIAALNLQPVYILTNPTMKAAGEGDSVAWAKMTDTEKEAYTKKQATRMLNLGPQNMANQIGQQAAVMGQMFTMMTPDQREQFQQALMESMRNMGGNAMFRMRPGGPRPGGGGPP